MTISVFDLFKVGIGPSSSHTVGPMRAARLFVTALEFDGLLNDVTGIRVELFGSLGATGHGHGSVKAVVLGLQGELPETVDPRAAEDAIAQVQASGRLDLLGRRPIGFAPGKDVILHRRRRLPFHPNGMLFAALGAAGPLAERTYYSVGGGFVVDQEEAGTTGASGEPVPVPHPFSTGAELLALTERTGLPVSSIMLANEVARCREDEVRSRLLHIWQVMRECVAQGCAASGTLPGGLKVRRRAGALRATLTQRDDRRDPLRAMEWVTMFALAVNEQNAAGGRVVTAPTNGAAGIIPAVLHYYSQFCPHACDDGIVRFLLTAGAIGALFKEGASISGAEVGCQGEVGSACSMAAAGLAEALGGTPRQVEYAAEIGIEHNLGLTCDPVGGLVQIPCIERNAIASVTAITAARMALSGDGTHHVPLDIAIKTMRQTGADMKDKYKETARGGLALNITEC